MAGSPADNQTLKGIIKSIKEGRKENFKNIVDKLHPYDTARLYERLPEKHQINFLLMLETSQLAELMQELEKDEQIDILHKLGPERLSQAMNLMDNDDLATLLYDLPQHEIETFLSLMKKEESAIVKNIMAYPPETAGRIMTNRYVWIPQHYSVGETVAKLKYFAEIAEALNYLYVIDDKKRLVGVVSYRDLILAESEEKIKNIMYSRVISATVDMDQEEVAQLIERYDFVALPVVEKDNVLKGIVTVDDVLDVVIEEAEEDIRKLSASGKAIDFNTKALTAASRRLPWLVLLLFVGLISGTIINEFEATLQKAVALAYFMPMIAGMTGNTGTQSLAVVVRELVSRNLDKKLIFRLVIRELGVGIAIGLTCGLLIAIIAYAWLGNVILGLVVGSSLLLTLIIGTLAGTIVPVVLYRLKVDPAVASGPLITTLNDIFSLTVYFGIATAFISFLM